MNSCWAGCLPTQPRFRLIAPSAGGWGLCFFFVSCQVTLPTLGCVAVLYKCILCFKFACKWKWFLYKVFVQIQSHFLILCDLDFVFFHLMFELLFPRLQRINELVVMRFLFPHSPSFCTKGVRGQVLRIKCRWGSGMFHSIEFPPCQSSVNLFLSVVHVCLYIFMSSFLKCFSGEN